MHIAFTTLNEARRFYEILEAQIATAVAAPRRSIPTLFPAFFTGILAEVGKLPTDQNGPALVELVGQMLSMNARVWFERYEPAAVHRWDSRFRGGGPENRILNVVDDKVDFLIAWKPDLERTVDRVLKDIRAQLVASDSELRRYPGELPFGMWSRMQRA
jgi:hypothetical protein